MKAVQFNKYGGPEVLHVIEVEEPHAGPGHVRIAVQAAGKTVPETLAIPSRLHCPQVSASKPRA
jgi:NADPH:quinone reductase-like Zn-dependent oxidoreductase